MAFIDKSRITFYCIAEVAISTARFARGALVFFFPRISLFRVCFIFVILFINVITIDKRKDVDICGYLLITTFLSTLHQI